MDMSGKTDKGILLVVSGPSGAGKGTICSAIRELYPDLHYSVSMTTRSPENVKSREKVISSEPRNSLNN